MGEADPVQMYLNDVFTVTVNLAGLPGVCVPTGLDGQGLEVLLGDRLRRIDVGDSILGERVGRGLRRQPLRM